MPRGWRNDPRWVQIYERRRKEREARERGRLSAAAQMDAILRQMPPPICVGPRRSGLIGDPPHDRDNPWF